MSLADQKTLCILPFWQRRGSGERKMWVGEIVKGSRLVEWWWPPNWRDSSRAVLQFRVPLCASGQIRLWSICRHGFDTVYIYTVQQLPFEMARLKEDCRWYPFQLDPVVHVHVDLHVPFIGYVWGGVYMCMFILNFPSVCTCTVHMLTITVLIWTALDTCRYMYE